jgi:hypothetical protein
VVVVVETCCVLDIDVVVNGDEEVTVELLPGLPVGGDPEGGVAFTPLRLLFAPVRVFKY